MSVAGREVFDWLPIFHLSTEEVFRSIRDAGQSPDRICGDWIPLFAVHRNLSYNWAILAKCTIIINEEFVCRP